MAILSNKLLASGFSRVGKVDVIVVSSNIFKFKEE